MSIEDQVRQKQSSIQQAILDQKRFEKKLRDFLSLASSMSDKELEIALARIADMLNTSQNGYAKESVHLKGMILNLYYKLRLSGIKKQSTFARIKRNVGVGIYMGEFAEYLISQIVSYHLPNLPQKNSDQYRDQNQFSERIKLLSP